MTLVRLRLEIDNGPDFEWIEMPMTMREICQHERANMLMRHKFGYDQHDAHVWCWLLEAMRNSRR